MSSSLSFDLSLKKICLFLLCMTSLGLTARTENYDNNAKGEVAEAVIEINKKRVNEIGRGSCGKTSKTAKLILPKDIVESYDDFRIVRREPGNKKDLDKIRCWPTITDNRDSTVHVDSDSLVFPEGFLLSDGQCKSKGTSGSNLLCVYPGTSGATDLIAQAHYAFETTVPSIDKIKNEAAANNEITFEVESSGKVDKVEICYGEKSSAQTLADLANAKGNCPSNFTKVVVVPPRIKIKNLKNKVEYVLKVRPLDHNATAYEWSKTYTFTPIPVLLPLNSYNGDGSQVSWSCQTSSSSSFSFLLLVGLFFIGLRIKKFKKSSSVAILCLTFFLMPAKDSHARLGQFNIGLLGSMYRPDLDSEKNGKIFPFYKSYFRKSSSDDDGPINPLLGFEADVHLFDNYGSLQLGLGVGYTFTQGQALEADVNDGADINKPVSSISATLHMYQFRPQLTYLMDYFKEYVPLVPYVRGALIAHGYSFTSNIDSSKKFATDPHGFRFGYQGALGLMLMLDFLEPGAVRAARGSGTLDHVYLKGELSYTKIDTFGSKGFQFSAKDVMGTSLPLMWTFGLVFELP
ncbi:MAG: hypothetical protein H6731_03110 [Myxococcales bacterium]|nr:MAG: hypothetical protein H6731_03110 [Myxococcales bacterium]